MDACDAPWTWIGESAGDGSYDILSLLGVECWGVSWMRLKCQKRHLTPSPMAMASMATFSRAEEELLLPNQKPIPFLLLAGPQPQPYS